MVVVGPMVREGVVGGCMWWCVEGVLDVYMVYIHVQRVYIGVNMVKGRCVQGKYKGYTIRWCVTLVLRSSLP